MVRYFSVGTTRALFVSILLVSFLLDEPDCAGAETVRQSVEALDDLDDDGWDDLWMGLFGKLIDPLDRTADSNGDGISDFDAMLAWKDPHSLTDESRDGGSGLSAAASLRNRREKVASRKAWLSRWMNKGLADSEGKPTTLAAVRQHKRSALEERIAEWRQGEAAHKAKVSHYLEKNGSSLPDALTKNRPPAQFRGDRPIFYGPLAIEEASDMGVHEIWPGGLQGLSYTGAITNIAMWDEGNVLTNHEQFLIPAASSGDDFESNSTSGGSGWAGDWSISGAFSVDANSLIDGVHSLGLSGQSNSATRLGFLTITDSGRRVQLSASIRAGWNVENDGDGSVNSEMGLHILDGSGGILFTFKFVEGDSSLLINGGGQDESRPAISFAQESVYDLVFASNIGSDQYSCTISRDDGLETDAAQNLQYVGRTTGSLGGFQFFVTAPSVQGNDGILDSVSIAATRVTNMESLALNTHATAVAATLCGSGDTTLLQPDIFANDDLERGRGVSYDSSVFSFTQFDDNIEMAVLDDEGLAICLSNHSYGVDCGWERIDGEWVWFGDPLISAVEDWKFGAYMKNISDTIDEVVFSKATLLPIFPVGNDGGNDDESGPSLGFQPVEHTVFQGGQPITSFEIRPRDDSYDDVEFLEYDTLRPHACCKNVLSVGGGLRHSEGPTDDGRIKPDLAVPPGSAFSAIATGAQDYGILEGTSASAALVTGTLNLAVSRYEELHQLGRPLLASTMKAIAIAACEVPSFGPNYDCGWGSLQPDRLAELIEADGASPGQHPIVKETRLVDGDSIQFPVTAEFGGMRVTVCWTDPAGEASVMPSVNDTTRMLVNDLDVRVIGPNGAVFFPYAPDPSDPEFVRLNPTPTGDNDTDNVEQVHTGNTAPAGIYDVIVTHKGTLEEPGGSNPPGQDVSIVISRIHATPQPEIPFEIVAVDRLTVDPNGPEEIGLTFTSVVGGRYQIERSVDLVNWTIDGGDILPTALLTTAMLSSNSASEFFRVRKLE